MIYKGWIFTLAIAPVLLLTCTCTTDQNITGNGSQTGNPTVVGILYQPDGKTPAAGVRVHIRPQKTLADTSGTGLTKRSATLAATDSVVTDSAGRYAFDTTLDTGTYVIEAASGNNAVLIDSVAVKTKATTDSLAPDTLKPAGALKGVIRLSEGGDPRKVFVLAFGIDRFARVNADGSFKFSMLAEGRYDLRLISSLDNYGVLDTVGMPVRSADTTNLDTISLPFTGIPTVRGLTASYDTLTGCTTLRWNKINRANIAGYAIFRGDTNASTPSRIGGNGLIIDTFYVDTVFTSLIDTNSHAYKYYLKAQDTASNLGNSYSTSVMIKTPSPTLVRTFFILNKIGTVQDIASIKDTVKIIANFTNKTRLNKSVTWSVDSFSSVQKTDSLSALTGIDTLSRSWAAPGTHKIYVKVIDAAGTAWIDSTRVTVILDLPVANAGNDTTVSINDTFIVHGSGTDQFGSIVKYRFDIKGDGTFDDSSTTSGQKSLVAPATAGDYNVILQVADDDGNTAKDTMVLHVLLDLPVANAGNDTTVGRGDTIHLKGSRSTDRFGHIVKYEWDIGNTGVFIKGSTGDTDIIADSTVNCILRISDDGSNTVFDTMNAYVVRFNQAVSAAGFSPRSGHTSVVFQNKIWVIGGYDGIFKNDVWYSSDGITWLQATSSANFAPRYEHTSVVFDNKIWVIGGATASGLTSDIWYSSDGINWTLSTSAPGFSSRIRHGSLVYDSKIWVIGGCDTSSQYYNKNDVWYSIDGTHWSQATANADFPARQSHSAFLLNNKMWIVGGYNGSTGLYSDIWFSSNGINWQQVTPSPGFSPRFGHSTITFNNRVWLFCGKGINPVGKTDMWYSDDGISWKLAVNSTDFSTRYKNTAIIFNDKLWIIGGTNDSGDLKNDIWFLK